MPSAALKHLAQRAGKSFDSAEHDWEKAKSIVSKEYGLSKKNPKFWALVTGIVKRMLGLKEALTFKDYIESVKIAETSVDDIENLTNELGEKTRKYRQMKDAKTLKAIQNVERKIQKNI